MDERDIRDARRLARQRGTSISRMFSGLIRVMARKQRTPPDGLDLGPLTRRLTGIISVPKGKTDRQLIEDAILWRHGFKK